MSELSKRLNKSTELMLRLSRQVEEARQRDNAITVERLIEEYDDRNDLLKLLRKFSAKQIKIMLGYAKNIEKAYSA